MNSMLLAASSGTTCPKKGQQELIMSKAVGLLKSPRPTLNKKLLSGARPPRNLVEDDDQQQPAEPSFRPDFSLLADLTLSPPTDDESSRAKSATITTTQVSEAVRSLPLYQLSPRVSTTSSSPRPTGTGTWNRSKPKIAAWDVA